MKEDSRKAPRRGRGEKVVVVKTPDVQLVSPSDYAVRQGASDTLLAVPTRWADVYDKAAASLKVMHAGVQLGTVKGKDVVPSQSLALSRQLDRSAFPTVNLAYADAVAYLRKEAVALPDGTPRGYVLPQATDGITRTIACRHTLAQTGQELDILVDNGCTVLDVIVEHPVYGQLTGQLQISSRYDVEQFLARIRDSDAAPLSLLTGGLHLHTLRCPNEDAYTRACAALKAAGLLLDD